MKCVSNTFYKMEGVNLSQRSDTHVSENNIFTTWVDMK